MSKLSITPIYTSSQFTKPLYKIGEAAKLLGCTPQSLRNMDRDGRLPAFRTESGQRLISRDALIGWLKSRKLLTDDHQIQKRDAIYARVSSNEQKLKGDLDRQAATILEKMRNLKNPIILKEVGSGLNDRRKQLQKLISLVMEAR